MGKTAVAIDLAQRLGTEIVSADSRQIFKGMPIGTAAPSPDELQAVKHHFIACKELTDYYSAAQFEVDALEVIQEIFTRNQYAILCGGSMMYIDAVCHGIDDIPTISDDIRTSVASDYAQFGLDEMVSRLQRLDPEYCRNADLKNAKRIIHAIEICLQSGVPYSTLRTGNRKQRPFRIVKILLNMPREELFARINRRVDLMLEQGLLNEAKALYPLKHLNSLNTVGYNELFAYFDGEMEYHTACERIKKNTRVYAKKQLTWFARDPQIITLNPATATEEILKLL